MSARLEKSIVGLVQEEGKEKPELQDYVVRMRVDHQISISRHLLWLFSTSVILTYAIILLQGFNYYGFNLPYDFLKWLGIATIAETAAILTAVVAAIFKAKS